MHNYKKIQDNKILKKICWGGKIWNSSIVGTLGYDQVPSHTLLNLVYNA